MLTLRGSKLGQGETMPGMTAAEHAVMLQQQAQALTPGAGNQNQDMTNWWSKNWPFVASGAAALGILGYLISNKK